MTHELYPDVAAAGSLAAALRAVAAEEGAVLGEVTAHRTQPLHQATVRSAAPLRQDLEVTAGSAERCWVISGWGQGIWLIGGSTRRLADVVHAAQLWGDGVPVRAIRDAVPFVTPTRLAEAAEQGPAHVVAAQWRWLRDDATGAERALIDAAHAEPRLRQLYAYTSHRSLRFSTTTGFPFSPDVVCLETDRDGRFVVKTSFHGAVVGQTATAGEAVALAAGRLPEGLGPAVAGSYRD